MLSESSDVSEVHKCNPGFVLGWRNVRPFLPEALFPESFNTGTNKHWGSVEWAVARLAGEVGR